MAEPGGMAGVEGQEESGLGVVVTEVGGDDSWWFGDGREEGQRIDPLCLCQSLNRVERVKA